MRSNHAVARAAQARRWRQFGGALLTLAVAATTPGCLVGPDFVKPEVELNAEWTGEGDPRLDRAAATDPQWWKAFNDPALDALTELAHRDNLTLQIAGLRILEARAQLGISNAELYPHTGGASAGASAVKLSEHAANAGNIDHFYGEFQAGFDALWELDFWGKFRRGVRAAEADYLATVADYDDALVSLSAEVARTYVQIRTFEVLLEQANQNVELQTEGRRIAESRFNNGATSELDVVQAATLLETTKASIPRLERGLAQAQNALNTLLGKPTGFAETLLAETKGIPAIPAKVSVSMPAQLLRRRPDIRSAELRAMAQCERIGVAKAELYPSFTLSGMIGTQTAVGAGNSAPLFGPGTLAASVGAGVFWPLLNYPRILDNVRVQDARLEQALVAYVSTVIKAAQEVDDGIVGFLMAQDSIVFATSAEEAAQAAVKLALIQYQEGSVDYQRVLDTQRVLLQMQQQLTETRSAAVTDLIALYKALGGGWEVRADVEIVSESSQRQMEERTDWGSHFSKVQPPDDKKEPQAQPAARPAPPPPESRKK